MPKRQAQRIIDAKRGDRQTSIGNVTLTAPAAGVTDHGLLLGLSDDDHPQYLLATGARTLSGNLGVAAGVTIDGVDISAHAANAAAHHAPVTAGDGIGVTGQQVAVNSTVVRTTRQIVAGNGLSGGGALSADVALHVGAGAGLTVSADAIALTTPGSLGVTTSNNASGNHTHAITSSNNPGAAASILASDSGGGLTLVSLTGTTRVRSPMIDTASGALTLAPASDLVLNPGSGRVMVGGGDYIQASSYASQTTGWRITDAGAADFRYLFVDEMHAKSFIADLEQALAGGQIVSKSVAAVATDFALPAAGASATLRVRDLPSAPNMAVFQAGDFVGLRKFSRAGGALTVSWAWGTVSAYADGTGGNEGTQTWTFTRHSGTPGTASGTIPADSLVLDFGVTGNGFYEVNAVDGAYGLNSPYAQVVTWVTHPATQTVRTRLGNLRGIFGAANEYGLYAGSGTASSDSYLRISNTQVGLYNLPLRMYSGGTERVHIAAHDDVWIGPSSADKRLSWNGSTLSVTGSIVVQSGSSGYGNLADRPTSLLQINPSQHAVLTTGAVVFSETWQDAGALSQWETFIGAGEMSIVATADAQSGGKLLRVGNNSGDDMRWLVHSRLIPYDPTKIYKMRLRVRRTAGTGVVYAGFAGIAADGVTLVNIDGDNSNSRQHYFCVSGASPGSSWTEYIGYAQGWGTPSAVYGTPSRAHASVRYIRPLVAVNFNAVAGVTDVDFYEITAYDYPGSAGLYLTPLFTGYWDGSAWKTYFDYAGNARFAGEIVAASGSITGALSIGSAGGIYQGTGTLASPTTGLRIWNDGGVGRIGAYSSGVLQWSAGTNGKLIAGNNTLAIDANGIAIEPAAFYEALRAYKFTSGGEFIGGMYAISYRGVPSFDRVVVATDAPYESSLLLSSSSAGSYASSVEIWAANSQGGGQLILSGGSAPRLKVVAGLSISGDPGGLAGHTTVTSQTNFASNSSGIGTIKMKSTTSRDSAGFIKVYVGTTAYWVPVFSAVL